MISEKTLDVGCVHFENTSGDEKQWIPAAKKALVEWLWDNRRDLLLSAELVLGFSNELSRVQKAEAQTRPKKEEKKK